MIDHSVYNMHTTETDVCCTAVCTLSMNNNLMNKQL